MTGLLTAVVIPFGLGLDMLMRATAACLAAVTLVGMAAAIRLLPQGRHGRVLAGSAAVFTGVTMLSCGFFLLVPAVVAAVGALVIRGRGRGDCAEGGAGQGGSGQDTGGTAHGLGSFGWLGRGAQPLCPLGPSQPSRPPGARGRAPFAGQGRPSG